VQTKLEPKPDPVLRQHMEVTDLNVNIIKESTKNFIRSNTAESREEKFKQDHFQSQKSLKR
jgi:hypothetical protein